MSSLLLGDNYTEAACHGHRFRSTGSKPTITIFVAIVVSGYRYQELELLIEPSFNTFDWLLRLLVTTKVLIQLQRFTG